MGISVGKIVLVGRIGAVSEGAGVGNDVDSFLLLLQAAIEAENRMIMAIRLRILLNCTVWSLLLSRSACAPDGTTDPVAHERDLSIPPEQKMHERDLLIPPEQRMYGTFEMDPNLGDLS